MIPFVINVLHKRTNLDRNKCRKVFSSRRHELHEELHFVLGIGACKAEQSEGQSQQFVTVKNNFATWHMRPS